MEIFARIQKILTDNNGVVVRNYDYDPFGNQLIDNSDCANPFRYNQQYYDHESGYVYLRARYYDTTLGRFINEDPIFDGWNWYVYCGGNPVNRFDPSGLAWFDWKIWDSPIWDSLMGVSNAIDQTLCLGTGNFIRGEMLGITAYEPLNQQVYDDAYFGGAVIGYTASAYLIVSGGVSFVRAGGSILKNGAAATRVLPNGTIVASATVALNVPAIGAVATGAYGVGSIMFAEHRKRGTTSPSNRNRHENGQAQRKREQHGGEKGDANRRNYRDYKIPK